MKNLVQRLGIGLTALGIATGVYADDWYNNSQKAAGEFMQIRPNTPVWKMSRDELGHLMKGTAEMNSPDMERELKKTKEELMKQQNNQNNRSLPPENVVMTSDGKYLPADGYEWANPDKDGDLRVVRKDSGRTLSSFENNPDGEIDPQKAYDSKFFACNKWVEKNEEGVANANEFYGTKRRFRAGEQLKLVAVFGDLPTRNQVVLKIYSSNGDKVYEENFGKIKDNRIIGIHYGDEKNLISELEKAGTGKYEANWLVNDKLAGTCNFEIYGSEENREIKR